MQSSNSKHTRFAHLATTDCLALRFTEELLSCESIGSLIVHWLRNYGSFVGVFGYIYIFLPCLCMLCGVLHQVRYTPDGYLNVNELFPSRCFHFSCTSLAQSFMNSANSHQTPYLPNRVLVFSLLGLSNRLRTMRWQLRSGGWCLL